MISLSDLIDTAKRTEKDVNTAIFNQQLNINNNNKRIQVKNKIKANELYHKYYSLC